MILTFGKHKGRALSSVPDDYIEWMVNDTRQKLAIFEAELQRRKGGETWEERVIAAGLRALAKEHHPDRGGTTATMQAINAAAEALRDQAKVMERWKR